MLRLLEILPASEVDHSDDLVGKNVEFEIGFMLEVIELSVESSNCDIVDDNSPKLEPDIMIVFVIDVALGLDKSWMLKRSYRYQPQGLVRGSR